METVKVKALVDHLTVGDRNQMRTLARGEVFDCPKDRAKVLHGQGKVDYADDDPAPKSEAERERAAAHQQPRGDRAEAAVRRGPGATPPEQQVKKG